jgi:TolA-binding protein
LASLLLTASSRGGDLDFAHGLYRKEKFQLAAEEYSQYLSKQPNGPEATSAQFYLGECYLQLQQLPEASASFAAVWEKRRQKEGSPADQEVVEDWGAQSLYRLGQIAVQRREYAAGVDFLKQFRATFPEHSRRRQAEQFLAESAMGVDDLALAQSALDMLASMAPAAEGMTDRTDLIRARLLDRQGKGSEAKALLDELMKRWSSDAAKRESATGDLASDAAYQRGMLAWREKNWSEAAAVFARGREWSAGKASENAFALQEASARLALGERDQARTLIDQVKSRASDKETLGQVHLLTARWAASAGDVATAQEALKQVLSVAGSAGSVVAPTQIAVAEAWLADKNRPALARAQGIEEIASTMAEGESRRRVAYLAAVAYLDAREYADAGRLAGPILSSAPEHQKPSLEYILGVVRFHEGSLGEAIRLLTASAPLIDSTAAGSAWLLAGQAMLRGPAESFDVTAWKKILDPMLSRADGGRLLQALGDEAYRQKRLELAEEVFRAALGHEGLKSRPAEMVPAELGLGWALFDQSKWDAARGVFSSAADKASAGSNEKGEALYMLALVADRQGDRKSAMEGLARVFHEYPDSPWALPAGQRWAKLLSTEKKEEAAGAYGELIDRSPVGPAKAKGLYERGLLALERGDVSSARQDLEGVLSMPESAALVARSGIKLAELCQKEGNAAAGRVYLERAESVGVPASLRSAFMYRKGLVLRDVGEKTQALENLREVAKEDPTSEFGLAAMLATGEIAFEEKPAEAQVIYRELAARAKDGPYHSIARLRLAQAHLKLGEWDDAARESDALAAEKVDVATRDEAIYVRARVHQQKAEFDRARELYRTIIGPDRTETAAKAQFMVGETLFLQERWGEAIKEFLKVSILYPIADWQALALVEIGKCHLRLGEVAESKKAFNEVVEKYGNYPAARQAKEQLELLGRSSAEGK